MTNECTYKTITRYTDNYIKYITTVCLYHTFLQLKIITIIVFATRNTCLSYNF